MIRSAITSSCSINNSARSTVLSSWLCWVCSAVSAVSACTLCALCAAFSSIKSDILPIHLTFGIPYFNSLKGTKRVVHDGVRRFWHTYSHMAQCYRFILLYRVFDPNLYSHILQDKVLIVWQALHLNSSVRVTTYMNAHKTCFLFCSLRSSSSVKLRT